MTYEEFKAEYKKLLNRLVSYSPNEAGSAIYAEKIGELVDSVPDEWETDADIELGLS